ncbi:hypothetical protein [Alistipes sp.]|uniref:hypothetical protein n=1 Tax=Alistipes sp. TaxID=1872444 RepID=UPI0025BAD8BE|nr:hypothetical protein [Alistipes sp.]
MRNRLLATLLFASLCLDGMAQANASLSASGADKPAVAASGQAPAAEADTATVRKPLTINQRRQRRGLTDTHTLFVPKGQWVFGGTASYSTHTNDSYQFLIIEGINSEGYNFKVSPMIAYAFHDNMALGARFIYGRTLLRVDKADLKLGDEETGTEIHVNEYYELVHNYTAAVIWRQYIPLGRNKRFALFNEMSLSAGGSQGRFANDVPVKGTYETGFNLALGVSPGIIAFATNNMAVEVNVGVMGITYNSTKQVHNQVSEGRRTSSMMNFKVNIFSIGLGVAFYL